MSEDTVNQQKQQTLSSIVSTLLEDLRSGTGDKDRRRQVEEWLRTLAEKYPEFSIELGLRDYYLAESERLRSEFMEATELADKLSIARAVESFLDRATEYDRRARER